MIKSMKIKLSGGEFEIVRGTDFSVTSDNLAHLIYEEKGVWHIVSDPCKGKYAKTLITLPYQHIFSDIYIEMSDGTLDICDIICDNFEIRISGASLVAQTIHSQNLYLSASKADVHINADSVMTDIDCGYGCVTMNFKSYSFGYKISSKCGMGNVSLNSVVLPKRYVSDIGERRINVICGMGNVNINA